MSSNPKFPSSFCFCFFVILDSHSVAMHRSPSSSMRYITNNCILVLTCNALAHSANRHIHGYLAPKICFYHLLGAVNLSSYFFFSCFKFRLPFQTTVVQFWFHFQFLALAKSTCVKFSVCVFSVSEISFFVFSVSFSVFPVSPLLSPFLSL